MGFAPMPCAGAMHYKLSHEATQLGSREGHEFDLIGRSVCQWTMQTPENQKQKLPREIAHENANLGSQLLLCRVLAYISEHHTLHTSP